MAVKFGNLKVSFPGIDRCEFLHLSHYDGESRDHLHGEKVLMLFNSGKHLYADFNWPHWYEEHEQRFVFLRYSDYRGEGQILSYCPSVGVRHLGHLRGIDGGNAQVTVWFEGIRWELICEPYRLYYLIQFHYGSQGFFRSKYLSKLPRKLLSHG